MKTSLFALISIALLFSANLAGARTWPEAQSLASEYVAKMSLDDKIKVLKGQGLLKGPCDGTTSEVNSDVHFPAICMNDGPSGLRGVDDLVSAFPAGISVAATWNPRLMRARGEALGQEFRRKGVHVFLGPAADVTRAQGAGRAWEAFGADPYLNGEAVYETIVGVQSEGVQACVKHLIGNNQEQYRFTSTTKMDDKTLRELYFKPFQRAIDAGVTCVMCSYNKFNGESACKNPAIISEDGLLRKEGGFQGYVVSDWGASHGLGVGSVHESVNAGLDLEMPGGFIGIGGGVYNNLKIAVEANFVSQAALDKMAIRVISGWLKLEQDKAYPPVSFSVHDKSKNEYVNVRTEAHISLIREIGAASAVLLKNVDGALPLSPPATLAIIGLDAAPIVKTDCNMNACKLDGTISVGWGSGSNCLKHVIAPVIAIEATLSENNASTKVVPSLNDNIKSAVSAAQSADVAIVFVYTFSGENLLGFTEVDGVLGDRPNLNLLGNGEELIKSVAAANQNTIVVIHSVGSVVMESWVDLPSVKGVFMAGLPGEQTGQAIADVLFGKVNPSGRLPYTIAKNEDDFGVKIIPQALRNGVAPTIEYTEGIWTDYRRFNKLNITARFCFGYGLSYTTFAYDQLSIVRAVDGNSYNINFQVTNTGTRDGTEIVQLYLGFPTELGEPEKQLKGFDSVFIPKGESRNVSIPLRIQEMSVYDMQSRKWITPTGGFRVGVGSSLNDIHLEGSL